MTHTCSGDCLKPVPGPPGENFDLLGAREVAPPPRTKWAVWITFSYLWLPFVVLPIYASFERIPESYLEASGDLGAMGWTTFRRVTLPPDSPRRGILGKRAAQSPPLRGGEFTRPPNPCNAARRS